MDKTEVEAFGLNSQNGGWRVVKNRVIVKMEADLLVSAFKISIYEGYKVHYRQSIVIAQFGLIVKTEDKTVVID